MVVYKFAYYLTSVSILAVYFLRDYPPTHTHTHVLFHANTDAKLETGLFNTRSNHDTLDIWGLILAWEAVLCAVGCLAAALARRVNTNPIRGGN